MPDDPHADAERTTDLMDALQALVNHYKRFVKHRCEILADAETVLRGEPLPRFDIPEDLRDD
jgi:hypothetical protein